MTKYMFPIIASLFLWACDDVIIQEEEYVRITPNDLIGKYNVTYATYWAYGDVELPETLEQFTDSFQMRLSPSGDSLQWRSLTDNHRFEFDIAIASLPVEIKQYMRAAIPMWGEQVNYLGDMNNSGLPWYYYPYVSVADETVWSAYYKDAGSEVRLGGSPLSSSLDYYHFRAGAYASMQAIHDLRFRLISSEKISD